MQLVVFIGSLVFIELAQFIAHFLEVFQCIVLMVKLCSENPCVPGSIPGLGTNFTFSK